MDSILASLPAALATKKGHWSISWSPMVKQAAQALLVADDLETGDTTLSSEFVYAAADWVQMMKMI